MAMSPTNHLLVTTMNASVLQISVQQVINVSLYTDLLVIPLYHLRSESQQHNQNEIQSLTNGYPYSSPTSF